MQTPPRALTHIHTHCVNLNPILTNQFDTYLIPINFFYSNQFDHRFLKTKREKKKQNNLVVASTYTHTHRHRHLKIQLHLIFIDYNLIYTIQIRIPFHIYSSSSFMSPFFSLKYWKQHIANNINSNNNNFFLIRYVYIRYESTCFINTQMFSLNERK